MITPHQELVNALAARGRRYSILVTESGSTVLDSGSRNGRRARETEFHFTKSGFFWKATRRWKAWWLARGTSIKVWG